MGFQYIAKLILSKYDPSKLAKGSGRLLLLLTAFCFEDFIKPKATKRSFGNLTSQACELIEKKLVQSFD
jgi:hypothetical protein